MSLSFEAEDVIEVSEGAETAASTAAAVEHVAEDDKSHSPLDDSNDHAGPAVPTSLAAAGLSQTQVGEMILRMLYLQGSSTGFEIARHLRLPFGLVDQPLRFLCDEKCLEVAGGQMIGRVTYRFQMTDLGRMRAREAFDQCRYVGPAPVKLSDYAKYCRRQSIAGTACTSEMLEAAFSEIVIRDGLLDELGPAICGGRSIFLHGPAGNGKTMVAKGLGRLLNEFGGDIYVPYAIQAENAIITVFDPTIHRPTDTTEIARTLPLTDQPPMSDRNDDGGSIEQDDLWDLRWRRVRRPVVMTGGELTLDMLDMKYNSGSNFYQAPMHIKANGGVFLIDDFGRQIVSPRSLLNRWTIPLEEKVDYLTLETGKKLSVPFEQLTVFSTNLDPNELVDDAFLRRIRHKVEVSAPSRKLLASIFRFHCDRRGLTFEPQAFKQLYKHHYEAGRTPRASDARDLLEICESIALYRQQVPTMETSVLLEAADRFFARIGSQAA